MGERNTLMRELHDLGLAAWFGGSMMGAVGLNSAAEEHGNEVEKARIASSGWARWTPVNAAAIAVHLVGAAGLAVANRRRIATQKGVLASTVAKTALTGAALGATAYARVLGKKIELASSPDEEKVQAAEKHPISMNHAQGQLRVVQWAVPALTGGIEVLNSLHGEQQRPSQQLWGTMRRLATA